MAALVEILYSRGAVITGSDVSDRFYTDEILEKIGLKAQSFSVENITEEIDYVIYSAAYNLKTNPDLIEAEKLHIPCMLYTEALGSLSEHSYSIAVCGVHGKTTTTGMIGTILKDLPLSTQVLAGSVITSFNNSCTMTTPFVKNNSVPSYFFAETCEYQRHFMDFSPSKILLTSVESDHQDYYPTYTDIRNAFVEFIGKLPENGQLIFCCDDRGASDVATRAKIRRPDIELIPYGVTAENEYNLEFNSVEKGIQKFEIGNMGNFLLCVPGDHLVLNACGAVALVCEILKAEEKISPEEIEKIKESLLQFTGGKRRSEIIGQTKTPAGESIIFIDDYGHHPTAIRKTLDGYRKFYKGRKIIVDFMSHTYSRTQALLEDFAFSFDSADMIIFNKIYSSAREKAENFTVSGKLLYEKAKEKYNNVVYFPEIMDSYDFLVNFFKTPVEKKYSEGILFVTMGAGDNWKLGKRLYEEFNK